MKTFADVSYADIFLQERGYKPVEDSWSLESFPADFQGDDAIPDNQAYKEWCINTFNYGEQIYEAYREIAFTIDYRAEPPRTDYWQTPQETVRRKQGDCEDSIFLFFSQLSEVNIDGDIVWGWVVDKESTMSFAHVWYQVFDKEGKLYIIEGFSKGWNGIIPVEIINAVEERVPTLLLKHNQVNHVVDEMIPSFIKPFENAQFPGDIYLNNNGRIRDIFQKLQDMFHRYREHK
ncbi:MAG: hypothetical protein E3K32_00305 [wastewater metagenome]|nr:hypothetical protein [Candidatus Loosdrechtia aerotolerans]